MQSAPRILLSSPSVVSLQPLAERLRMRGYHVGVAGSLRDTWTALEQERYDALVLSLEFPVAGIDYLDPLVRSGFFRILFCTSPYPTLEGALRAMRGGACDYLAEPLDDLRLTAAMGRAFERQQSGHAEPKSKGPLPTWTALSERERQVVEALYSGVSPREIARSLSISHYTVRNHLRSIYSKLGVHSQRELLSLGRPQAPGVVPPP